MSFETITARLTGYFSRLDKGEGYTIVNDAWEDIRNNRLWSFQLGEDGVNTPNVVTAGTFTVVLGSNIVFPDATASAALGNLANPPITQRQFRVQGFSIYNIIAVDVPAAPTQITLDRIYVDPSGVSLPYQVFQSYYPAPVADFKRYITWRDMVNGEWLSIYTTRREADMGDPQRLYYTFPHWVLPFSIDNRGAGTATPSATLGFTLHELYPNPLQQISYMRYWIRTGAELVNPGDTVPYPIPDDLLFHRARMLAAQLAESQKDPSIPRGSGTDYKFVYQAAKAEYDTQLHDIGMKDRDLVDLFFSRIPKPQHGIEKNAYYSTLLQRAYSGL